MTNIRTTLISAALALGAMTGSAFAETTLQVFLWNQSGAMAKDHRIENGADKTTDSMGVTLSATTIKAGEVTFDVLNTSKVFWHEMVVTKLDGPDATLPYKGNKVDEDMAGSLGEVAELEPGQDGSLTLTLEPGTYVVYCNVPRHYNAGMWTILTVVE